METTEKDRQLDRREGEGEHSKLKKNIHKNTHTNKHTYTNKDTCTNKHIHK